jgi:hypothetical protein
MYYWCTAQNTQWVLARSTLERIHQFVVDVEYDAYIVVQYYAPQDSMLYKQTDWTATREETWEVDSSVMNALKHKHHICSIEKTTRSCFGWSNREKIVNFLKEQWINWVHYIGFDSNDCVLASLYSSLWEGLYSFVLEELVHHNAWNQELHNAAITLFRHYHLTNNSLHKKINSIVVSL